MNPTIHVHLRATGGGAQMARKLAAEINDLIASTPEYAEIAFVVVEGVIQSVGLERPVPKQRPPWRTRFRRRTPQRPTRLPSWALSMGSDLLISIQEVERAINEVREEAASMGVDPFKLRDAHGNWVMAPLVAARADARIALIEYAGALDRLRLVCAELA